jgi:hypothetical protein
VNTQVNALSKIHFESLSDEELSRYDKLLEELRELLPGRGAQQVDWHGEAINDLPPSGALRLDRLVNAVK